ncbi:MAG: nucleotide exchange factor GrpE [Candidatus Accumulibacter sp.]|uniref:nucleotide exchange factor GrpE n=1 Tax=Accumulibacter sp. TaxID=2053492 RepID=UPI0028785A92|nr:nucleotide exchange factor GrpE [Accumulibacter sp.]MDS4015465.1 nucleotide exchange factor GrpE [Accumulibacter sp.]
MNAWSIKADEAQREVLVEEFRNRLAQALATTEDGQEPAAAGDQSAGASREVDLATLLGEIAMLRNELRLQSRQFKQTLEELRRFGDDLRTNNERLQRDLERAHEQTSLVAQQTARPLLLALLDLRDRLQAGVDAAGRMPSSIMTRLVPGPQRFAASLAEGQRLSLQRLDELLAGQRVRAMRVEGEAFDPQRMRVVGVESGTAAAVADGTVLREVRRGFYHDDGLLRLAEVIVSKKANP